MELDVFEVFLGHGENITRVSEEDITALLILRHVLVLALLEILELRIIVALYPTSLVEMVELVDKQLCHTLVHQLVDTLLQLFGAHGIIVLYVFEELWRE